MDLVSAMRNVTFSVVSYRIYFNEAVVTSRFRLFSVVETEPRI